MLFKYMKRNFKKVITLTLSIYLIFSVFIVSYAENYEWTVINNDTVETNSSLEGENIEIWLDPREELSVNEMLKAMCVVSANDYDVQFRHE